MPRPPRPWFRFYVEAIHDPKLRRLTPAQRWLWVAVLAMARQSPVPGHLLIACAEDDVEPLSLADLADAAAVKLSDVRSGMEAFRRMGMVTVDQDLGCDVVAKFSERQFESDEVAQRTRKYRSKRDATPTDGTTLERSYDVPGNGDVTVLGTSPKKEGDLKHHQTTFSGSDVPLDDDGIGSNVPTAGQTPRSRRAETACDLLGDRAFEAAEQAGKVQSSAGGYRFSCRRTARTDHLDDARELAFRYPEVSAVELAEMLQPSAWNAPEPRRAEPRPGALYEAAEARRRERDTTVPTPDRDRNLNGIAAARTARRGAQP